MSEVKTKGSPDSLLNALAAYTVRAPAQLNGKAERAAKTTIIDTMAVALGALNHLPAQLARRYARFVKTVGGATIWGTGELVSAETAALVNAVPLRAFDYNDFYFSKSSGHPSDMIPGLIALAEWRRYPGRRVLDSIVVGYEICLALFDTLKVGEYGWDYPILTAIGSTCAVARLLDLTEAQTREAIAITITSHYPSDEVESHELNTRGDLTMWKRFNGGNATRQAVFAGLLAEQGVEGVVRPFEGKMGMLSKLPPEPDDLAALFKRLASNEPLTSITEIRFKRWPVGSRGQSAIQAVLQARALIGDVSRIAKVNIFSDSMAYDHLFMQRSDPWHPDSRETADHSLPFIVTTALLDGFVKTSSFDLENVRSNEKQNFLNGKVSIQISEELSVGARGGFPTAVELIDVNGNKYLGEGLAPPGHPSHPFHGSDFDEKFFENVVPIYGKEKSQELVAMMWDFDELKDLGSFTSQLVFRDKGTIDAPAAIRS